MKIRYQNGTVVEAVILFRSEDCMRMALRGAEDITELTKVRGTWISDDCEPVSVEPAAVSPVVRDYSDDYFICSRQLAESLATPLFTDGIEDLLEDQSAVNPIYAGISRLLA